MKQDYLRWAISKTKTTWWHDSADPAELKRGLERGAIGATTNPFLASVALHANKACGRGRFKACSRRIPSPRRRRKG